MNFKCFNILDLRNLQEQVKKTFCFKICSDLAFTVWMNYSSDLKNVANSRPSNSNFKCFSHSLRQFFITVDQKIFGNKIPMISRYLFFNDFLWMKKCSIILKIATYFHNYRQHMKIYQCLKSQRPVLSLKIKWSNVTLGLDYLVFVYSRSLKTREIYTNWDNLVCLSLYIFWGQSHLCLLLQNTFF